MSLTKRVEPGKIEIEFVNGVIFVRDDTIISEDGKELSRTIHRTSYEPTLDPKLHNELAQKIALLFWTPDTVKKYQELRNKAFESILGVRDAE